MDTMNMQQELVKKAQAIPTDVRKNILISFSETELHENLKYLFQKMDPNCIVEVTHGASEYGKDLVLVRNDNFGQTVTAVVVKVGDIRAKTLGKVDEIKSQIDQAVKHPVKLKSVSGYLRVSDIWVVLDGEISNNAQDRLQSEVQVSVRIYDIAWLIDNFSRYYPQIFFEGQVTDFLQKTIQNLENAHLFRAKHLTLSEYFVDPVVAAVDVPVSFDEEQFALIVQEKKVPFSFLTSLTKAHRRIILSGDPGVGKSVALRKLAINMLRKASSQTLRGKRTSNKIEVPILITASELVKHKTADDLIEEYFHSPEIASRFRVGALFVDGLDEAHPNIRSNVLKKASAFASQLNSALIITSRKIDLIKSAPSGFEKYELLPFEFGQAIKFLNKLISDSQVLDVLKDGLNTIKFHIALTPLSLYLLLEIAEAHKELPASIVELYDRYCDLVLGRYDKDRGIEVLFDYLIKKRFLASLSYHEFFEKGRLTIGRDDFDRFLREYAATYGWPSERFMDFSHDIERSGTLDLQDSQSITFRHRSFLDYFTAYYLLENREIFEDIDTKIVSIYFDDVWSDVALFYVGLKRDIKSSVLEKLFSYDGEDIVTSINKLLVGRLLQAAWHTTYKNKIDGLSKASDYIIPTKEKFLSMTHSAEINFPDILADWFIMTLAEYSFGSGLLEDVVKQIADRLSEAPSYENIYKMVALLWASRRFLEDDEIYTRIDAVLDVMSQVSLSPRDESIVLLLLDIIEKKNRALSKTIQKRLRRLGKAHPALFREILPAPSQRKRKRDRK